MIHLSHNNKLIENKKTAKASGDKIDLLINKIINNDDPKKIIKNKSTDSFNNWVMPEEPKGFMRFKKHDPL